MDNIPERILWLLGRVADQRSRHIAQHLKLAEWPVFAALQQLEREGKVQRVTVKRRLETITVYRLSASGPCARVIGNPARDYCFSRATPNGGQNAATVVASSGGL